MFTKTSVLFALAAISSVNAHGALVAIAGANGVNGQGFGVVDTTPRDGTKRNPFQADTSIIRDADIANGNAGPCGRTTVGGPNDMAAQLEAASEAGLPTAAADGSITMTIHQVNGDGAGPYTCGVSADASGQKFVDMKVITNVPGQNSRSRAKAQDFPLVAQMPAGVACSGGPNGDACIVRCRNAARAGPFGGCAAVAGPAAAAAPAAKKTTSSVAPTPTAPNRAAPTAGKGNGTGGNGAGAGGNGNGAGGKGNGTGGNGAGAGGNGNVNGAGGNVNGAGGNGNGAEGNGTGAGDNGAGAGGNNNGNNNGNGNGNGNGNNNGNGNGNDNGNGDGAEDNGAGAEAKRSAGSVTIAEAENALAKDIYKRALNVNKSFEKKRVLKTRVAGAKAGYWI